jgi:hypothetical protein
MGPYYMLNTYSGVVENKLPILNVILPKWYLRDNPSLRSTLYDNENALVTAMDLHETWRHMLDISHKPTPVSKGKSLFSEIPNRTCQEAQIEDSFCACNKGQNL